MVINKILIYETKIQQRIAKEAGNEGYVILIMLVNFVADKVKKNIFSNIIIWVFDLKSSL